MTYPVEKLGVVIPVGPGRRDNVDLSLAYLATQTGLSEEAPLEVQIVCDGPAAWADCGSVTTSDPRLLVDVVGMEKHAPGHEPPRNVGVRMLVGRRPSVDHVWFLDSDIILEPQALQAFLEALDGREPDGVLCGPYDWGSAGLREMVPRGDSRVEIHDYRWAMFDENPPHEKLFFHLGAALANFSGNLVWPVAEFKRIGGFHWDLTAGRCDDGCLGVRAAVHGIASSFVAAARGLHISHPINLEWVHQANARDVPLINQWHPYIQELGVIPRNLDGVRFNMICQECGEEINTLEIWEHGTKHRDAGPEYLRLPDLSEA